MITSCYVLPGLPVQQELEMDLAFSQWYRQHMDLAERHTEIADWIRDERNEALGIVFDARNYQKPYFDF